MNRFLGCVPGFPVRERAQALAGSDTKTFPESLGTNKDQAPMRKPSDWGWVGGAPKGSRCQDPHLLLGAPGRLSP